MWITAAGTRTLAGVISSVQYLMVLKRWYTCGEMSGVGLVPGCLFSAYFIRGRRLAKPFVRRLSLEETADYERAGEGAEWMTGAETAATVKAVPGLQIIETQRLRLLVRPGLGAPEVIGRLQGRALQCDCWRVCADPVGCGESYEFDEDE